MSCVGCIRTRSPRVASGNSSVKEVSVAVQATDGASEKKLHPASMLLFSFFLARRVAARKIKGATLRSTTGLSLAKRHFRPAFGLAIARTIYLLSFLYFSTTYSTHKSTQLPARARTAYTPSSLNRVSCYQLQPVTILLQPAIHCYVPPSIDIGRLSPLNYNSQHHSAGSTLLIKLKSP